MIDHPLECRATLFQFHSLYSCMQCTWYCTWRLIIMIICPLHTFSSERVTSPLDLGLAGTGLAPARGFETLRHTQRRDSLQTHTATATAAARATATPARWCRKERSPVYSCSLPRTAWLLLSDKVDATRVVFLS